MTGKEPKEQFILKELKPSLELVLDAAGDSLSQQAETRFEIGAEYAIEGLRSIQAYQLICELLGKRNEAREADKWVAVAKGVIKEFYI